MFTCEFCEEEHSVGFECKKCTEIESISNAREIKVCNDCCQCDLRIHGAKRWPPRPLVIDESNVPF